MKKLLILILAISTLCTEVRKVKLSEITDDSYVPMKTNQKIIFELEGNPTTGYIWTVSNLDKLKENGIVEATNLNEKNSGVFYKSPSESVGVGGIYHFEFNAQEKQGHEIIQFSYKRPWEDENSITKSVNVQVFDKQEGQDL
jgi:predicted secreted protein